MSSKTAVVVCGRFNPLTKGHCYLIKTAKNYAEDNGYDLYVLPTRTEGNARNPIPYKDKMSIVREMFPDVNFIEDSYIHHLHDLVEMLKCYSYENFIGFGDEERRALYESIPNMTYFSLGSREEDGDGLMGISATKAREYARNGDVQNYLKMMPENMSLKRLDEVYNKIREYN